MPGEGQEEITIAGLYGAILAQRDWFDSKLGEFERSMVGEVRALHVELEAIRIADAGLPCQQHSEDIAELKHATRGTPSGLTITLSAPSWATLAKWTVAAVAGLGLAAATIRDQVGAFLWMLWGTKGS